MVMVLALRIRDYPDLEFGVLSKDSLFGLRPEPDLVDGVRGIRDELPQKDLGMRIQRIDNELQNFLNLCLELVCLFLMLCLLHSASVCSGV